MRSTDGLGRRPARAWCEASWMYPRFCRSRHLSLSSCDLRPVLACRVLPDLAVPAAARPNCCACATAWPTRLAPGCTLAQPATSLPPLVGSYPTVSALTGPLLPATCAGIAFCCGCSRRGLLREPQRPHLLFREATAPCWHTGGSREVPLAARRTDAQRRRSSLLFCCQGAALLTTRLYHTKRRAHKEEELREELRSLDPSFIK